MSDYIKREDAIRQIVKTSAQNELDIHAIGTVIYILSEMDSADVVEVVRCRDCKWWRPFNDRMGHCGRGEMRHKDFYCQRGERADT